MHDDKSRVVKVQLLCSLNTLQGFLNKIKSYLLIVQAKQVRQGSSAVLLKNHAKASTEFIIQIDWPHCPLTKAAWRFI